MSKTEDMIAEIAESALPTPAWNGHPGDPAQVLEGDLRSLMHRLADAQMDLEESNKRGKKEIQEIFLAILEVGDAFDRVLQNIRAKEDQVTPQMKKWLDNFGSVRRKLQTLLADRGVRPLQSLDRQFDPQWHRIVETIADPAQPDGSIAEEVTAGYLWSATLLRRAEVIIVRSDDDAST